MRVVKVALFTLILISFSVAGPKKREVKIFVTGDREAAFTESFYMAVREWMRISQEDNKNFTFVHVPPSEAEYVVFLLMNKDSESCVYGTVMVLWKRDSNKTFEKMDQQLGCNSDEMAKKAVEAMEAAMGLKPSWQIKIPGRMQ